MFATLDDDGSGKIELGEAKKLAADLVECFGNVAASSVSLASTPSLCPVRLAGEVRAVLKKLEEASQAATNELNKVRKSAAAMRRKSLVSEQEIIELESHDLRLSAQREAEERAEEERKKAEMQAREEAKAKARAKAESMAALKKAEFEARVAAKRTIKLVTPQACAAQPTEPMCPVLPAQFCDAHTNMC